MNLRISTEILKDMVARSFKGASCNKLIPLSTMMSIKCKNGKLVLTTTDGINYLYISKKVDNTEDFDVVIYADQFSRLVAKVTCDMVEMEVKNNALEIKADGAYKMDIPLDEGEYIQYPDPLSEINIADQQGIDVKSSVIESILDSCKPSLATTLEVPCYTGYFCGEHVITTNTFNISILDANLFRENVLVAPEYMELLALMTEEKFYCYLDGDTILSTSEDCTVVGKKLDGIEDYPVGAILDYASQELESSCKIRKSVMLSILDRISLFVGPYDENVIHLIFEQGGIRVESKQDNGVEYIDYSKIDNFKPFEGMVDIQLLTSLLKAYPEEEVKVCFGNPRTMKLEGNGIKFISAWIVSDDGEGDLNE